MHAMNDRRATELLDEWLDSYLNFEKLPKKNIFWLDTIEYLCNRFSNPQNDYNSVHVAGSKGKGSVSTMISSILDEIGLSCGLYTSPHILDLSERISLAHGPLSEAIYETSVKELVYKVESIIPENLPNQREITWFELITLFAFICYKNAKVDWAVFETGLGGRLDATNIIKPNITVLTPIELEHTEYLGNTIELIATEKAGIIKPKTPVCVSKQKKEAMFVFEQKAKELNAPLIKIEDVLEKCSFTLPENWNNHKKEYNWQPSMKIELVFNKYFNRPIKTNLKLVGKVQAENAALAALTVKLLFPEVDETVIEKGLSKARMPGRFEVVSNPFRKDFFLPVVLDGAHTGNSLSGTIDTFFEIFGPRNNISSLKINNIEKNKSLNTTNEMTFDHLNIGEISVDKSLNTTNEMPLDPHLLFACAADKNVHDMIRIILNDNNYFSHIELTKPGSDKKANIPALLNEFTIQLSDKKQNDKYTKMSYELTEDYTFAITKALQESAQKKVPLLVTGSFYLVCEVKKILQENMSKSF